MLPLEATLIKIHIHLIVFDRQVYREIKLIAVMLMTSSKTRVPELNMIARGELKMIAIICSLGEKPVKLSIEVPRQRFWLLSRFCWKPVGLSL